MTDYKNSLNLPKTDFPMRANLNEREPEILKRWAQLDIYSQIRQLRHDHKKFILHDGPPYANGRPHLGTALNKILKDIIVKSKSFSDYDAPFVPGWDCHGLPIELNVEQKHGKVGSGLSANEFRKLCREYASSQVILQLNDFQRIGVIADWQHPYRTMDYSYEANAVRALARVIQNGYLQRGQKPVYWCTACGSSLAEAEVEYRDKASPAVDVAFVAIDPMDALSRFERTQEAGARVIMPIWTTTPWTLPANQAIAVHPDHLYALIQCQLQGQMTYLILVQEQIEAAMLRYGIDQYTVCHHVPGKALSGIIVQHPFLERRVPVVLGTHVTVDAGTGNVHTAPAHGLEDYKLGEQYALSMDTPVDSRSCFAEGTPLVSGLFVFKANEPIIVALADRGLLLHQAVIQHSYPHCWRHKTPLIFRATSQWFIALDRGLRNQALQAIKQTTWLPHWGQTRIAQMVADRPDWCISRQRLWGIPLPLFAHKNTHVLHPNTVDLLARIAEKIEKQGVEAWFNSQVSDWLGQEASDYDAIMDTLDIWFDSGVTHFCVLAQRPDLGFPADLYFEGSDQHRGWFQSSLLTALAISEHAPYKTVLTHGYVVDGEGRKMSKSLGNTIVPEEIIRDFGADILRLWAASVDHTVEINASKEIFQRAAEAYRRIRNTARFLLSNLYDFNPTKDLVEASQLIALDRWAIVSTLELQEKVIAAYEEYHFSFIYQAIHNFCTVTMGNFYLDIIKDRLYTAKSDSLARRSAQTALYYIIEIFVRLLAPITSFTADEIWSFIPGQRAASVFLTTWYSDYPKLSLPAHEREQWTTLLRVRDEVNKLLEQHRQLGEIGSGLSAEVTLYVSPAYYSLLKAMSVELRFALITSEALLRPLQEKTETAESTALPDLWVSITPSKYKKCARCWQQRESVGQFDSHPDVCERCVENVLGPGEIRNYA